MPIVIDVQSAAVIARLSDMLNQINYVKRTGIGAALSQFQTEDMHRDRPFTMRSRGAGRATTIVRPHSLYEMQRSEMASRQFARATIRYQKFIASGRKYRKRRPKYIAIAMRNYRKWSTRPILRDVMYDKLKDRLEKMMSEKLRWEHSRHKAAAARVEDRVEHAVEQLVIRRWGAAGAAAVQVFKGARAATRGGGSGD
jgi:hypothetical protein